MISPGLSLEVEHARRFVDERSRAWDEMSGTVASVGIIATLVNVPLVSDGLLTIEASDWPVLVAIDGKSTIAELAVPARRSPFEAAQSVCRLTRAGLARLEVDEPAQRNEAGSNFPALGLAAYTSGAAAGAIGAGSSVSDIRSRSTAAAHDLPSAIAQTMSDWPRPISPQTYTPSADVW